MSLELALLDDHKIAREQVRIIKFFVILTHATLSHHQKVVWDSNLNEKLYVYIRTKVLRSNKVKGFSKPIKIQVFLFLANFDFRPAYVKWKKLFVRCADAISEISGKKRSPNFAEPAKKLMKIEIFNFLIRHIYAGANELISGWREKD